MISSLGYFCLCVWLQGEGAFQGKMSKQTWCPLPSLAIGSIGPSSTDIVTKKSRGETALLPLSQELQVREVGSLCRRMGKLYISSTDVRINA